MPCHCWSCLAGERCATSYQTEIAELRIEAETAARQLEGERQTNRQLLAALERARVAVNEAADGWPYLEGQPHA